MASFTSPTLHATGDDLAVTDYNNVANNTTFLYQGPYSYASNSVGVVVATSTVVQITLGTVTSGYGTSIASNNIVVPVAGLYQIYAEIIWPDAASGISQLLVAQNGVNQRTSGPVSIHASGSGAVNSTMLLRTAAASDTFTLNAFQTSGGNVTVGAGQGILEVVFLGSV